MQWASGSPAGSRWRPISLPDSVADRDDIGRTHASRLTRPAGDEQPIVMSARRRQPLWD